jgi:hypothetical protein
MKTSILMSATTWNVALQVTSADRLYLLVASRARCDDLIQAEVGIEELLLSAPEHDRSYQYRGRRMEEVCFHLQRVYHLQHNSEHGQMGA